MQEACMNEICYKENFNLENKVALVTGAAGYLGAYIAEGLGVAGAHVILNGRSQKKLLALQQKLCEKNIQSTVLEFDITDYHVLSEKIISLEKNFESIDILVNNAHQGRATSYDDAKPEDFFRDYSVNVVASFELIKQIRPLMQKASTQNGDASIINIASMYGVISPDPRIYSDSRMNNPPFYGTAKAGMIQLSKYMACHLASDGIRVNSISPGPFPSIDVIEQKRSFIERLKSKLPMNRIGHPSELIGPIVFLASKASSFVTGINLPVDGGWTAW